MLGHQFDIQSLDSQELAFSDSSDHYDFFLKRDALHHLETDLTFSILGRYHCKLGCEICLLNNLWLKESSINRTTAKEINANYLLKLKSLFKRFYSIACIDDLKFLKKNYPEHFSLYYELAPLMEFHTTDNGFFSQFEILMNELKFKEIGQISFSDHFLSRGSGEIVNRILGMMSELNDRSAISRVNLIITKPGAEENIHLMKLVRWLESIDQSVKIYFHNDVKNNDDHLEGIRQLGYNAPTVYQARLSSDGLEKCEIITETVHLRYNSFYPDLYSSMDEDFSGYYQFNDNKQFNINKFLLSTLNNKKEVYARYAEKPYLSQNLKEYFRCISLNLIINKDFNYIPSVLLAPTSYFYKSLIYDGFINTYAGLIKKEATEVVPILELVSR